MPTLVAIAGLTQQTHAGIGTGGTQTKYFDTINGTPGTQISVVQDSDFASGWCLEITGNAAAAFAGFFNAANNGVLGSSGTLVGSFRFKFPTLPSNDFDILRIIGTGGGNDAILKYLTSTTGLQGVLGASTQLGPTISGGAIKRVDFKAVLNSGSQTFDWQIDGSAQTQVTLSATTQNLFKAGFGNDAGTQNGTIRVGDIVLSLTAADYPLGAHKVVLLKVDPSGTLTFGGSATSTDWRTFAGATPTLTAWNATTARDAIDEVPPNLGSSQDGLCLVTDTPTNTWYVEIPMTTYTIGSGETVSGARSVVCGWQQTTSGANCGLRSWNGTTERTLVNTSTSFTTLGNNSTTAVGWLCKMLTVADIDTQTELDALALRWGFSTDANPDIGIQAAYVEVAIKESTSTDATPTPAAVVGTVAVPQATPSASSTVAPSATSAVATVPQAVAAISVTQVPAVTAAVVGLPAATITANATVTPNVISASVTAPQAGASVAAGPAAVSTVVGFPQATPVTAGNATTTPAATVVVVGAPQATVSASSTVTPATTTAAVSLPSATAQGGAVTTPAAVVTAVTVPRSDVSVSAGPAVVAAIVSVPQASALAGGNATVQPTAITGTATFPSATPSAGATATPAQIASTVALPAAIPAVSDTALPAAIVSTTALPQATPVTAGNATAQPAPIVTVVTAPAATPHAAAVVSPSSIVVLTGLPLASAGVSVFGQPATITTTVTVPLVTVFGTPPTFGTAAGAVGPVPGALAATGSAPSASAGLMPVPTATGA